MAIGKMSENTCNSMLAEYLNSDGVKAFFERHFTTLDGIKKPDIFIEDDGYFFIEGKQRPQAQLIHAVSKAHIYKESIKSSVTSKGVFAVLYPENCDGACEAAVLLDNPPYYIEHKSKSLRDLSDWIKSIVEKPVIATEINTGHAIRLLHQAVDYIHHAFTKLDIDEIDEIFGGKTFFETVLGYEVEDQVPKQHLKIAAAYVLVNQIMFYQVLARETKDYEPLDFEKILSPSELQSKYFAKVLLKDYKPIFDFDIASKLIGQDSTDAIRTTINAINALAPEKHGHDILGKIFHNLIPFEIRKSVAAFFTNSESAELLASLSIDDTNATIIDPACGSGTLLVAAYHRKKELIELSKKNFTASDHKKFVTKQITGIDIMPFSCHLSAVHLALQAPLFETEKVRIAIHDSTSLSPGRSIEAAEESLKEAYKTKRMSDYFEGMSAKDDVRRKTIKGAVTLSDKKAKPILLESTDIVIMNPPFTRAERLPEDYKSLLINRFGDYKKAIFGRVGLHLFFIFLADKFVKPGGRIAMVLPATVLRIESMKGIRQILTTNYHIEHIISSFQRSAFSEASDFREILLIARKLNGEVSDDLKCAVTILKKLPLNATEARELATRLRAAISKITTSQSYVDEDVTTNLVPQVKLKEMINNMYPLIALSDLTLNNDLDKIKKKVGAKLVKCGNYFSENNINAFEDVYIPPYNSTFVLKHKETALKTIDRWIVSKMETTHLEAQDRFSHQTIKVPLRCTDRGFRRPSGVHIMDVTETLDYIVVDGFLGANKIFPDEKQAKLALSTISKWRKNVSSKKANLLMSRRFNISAPGTRLLAFYTTIPAFGVDMWSVKGLADDDAKILCIWENSILSLLQLIINRTETEGAWLKLHQSQIYDSHILNIGSLDDKDRTTLIELFDEISNYEFPNLIDQLERRDPIRVKIDKTLFKILGIQPAESEHLVSKLYSSIADEINNLRSMMAG